MIFCVLRHERSAVPAFLINEHSVQQLNRNESKIYLDCKGILIYAEGKRIFCAVV